MRFFFRLSTKDLRKTSRRLQVESLENRRLLASIPFGANTTDLGEFLLGSVAVTPILLESNGTLDADTETWDGNEVADTLNDINTGLDWWVDTLAAQNSVHEVSFTVDPDFSSQVFETKYEPISRRSNDYSFYVAEFLSGAGFSSGNLESDIKAFNQSQREKLGTDWSFTIFVVNSENDSDGEFAAGGSFSRAFAFAGGLFMIVPSTRPASTYAHELGHMFWARDEYTGGGSYFSRRGYYNTQNLNAADNPTPGFVQQPSIMASGSLLDFAYDNHDSPPSTLAMLGWQDSDGDGIFDVLDVPHRLTGNGYFDVATGNYRFQGEATVQTLPNLNSSGLKNDITINRIREIEYRFDGAGDWQTYSLPDAYEVDLDLTISVPSGASEIEIRARDSKSTVVSNVFVGRLSRADATLVPGINGFTWHDENENGLRDLGEFGEAGWTVELVDANGDVLSLRTDIEPDDYPDGVLQNGFSPAITLTSVGADSDGRVAVFSDSASSTSTGTKNFRGFSKGSQTFVSTWSSSSRRLQVDFATPTTSVSIDAIGAFSNNYARLEAFNTSGQLLGRYTTGRLDAGDIETMTIQRGSADIAYVIAGGHGSSVKLDNLTFGPEATTLTGFNGQYAFPGLPADDYTVRITPGPGYRTLDPISGELPATVVANSAATDVDFGFEVATSEWQNPRDRLDVNDDRIISALDVLLIVNEINANGTRDLRGSGISSPPYIDVTGESLVSALDVLTVINFINSRGSSEGEGQNSTLAGEEDGVGSLQVCVGLPLGDPPSAEGEFSFPIDLVDGVEEELLWMMAYEQTQL